MQYYYIYIFSIPLILYFGIKTWLENNPDALMKLLSQLVKLRSSIKQKQIEKFVRENTDMYYKSLEKDWKKQGWTIDELKEVSKHTRKETEEIYRNMYHKLYDDERDDVEDFFNI